MRQLGVLVTLLVCLDMQGFAQIISLKTVPVAAGDQFALFPSRNSSMGGISLALEDPLLDSFVNPAKGAKSKGIRFFTAPAYYSVSLERTSALPSGRTLPLGLCFSNEAFFGGLLWARQQLTNERSAVVVPALQMESALKDDAPQPHNNYTFVMGGRKLEDSDIGIGASIFWADLNAIEGVQHLYASSSNVRQSGYLAHYRVGVFAPLEGDREFEAVLLHHQFKMTHEVSYTGWRPGDSFISPPHTRTERERDETNGWAARIGYRQPVGERWTMGIQANGNWKWHPKIPNYELMNIPRDPGNSSAYQIGLGFARSGEVGMFGLEVVYEPIWSNTWADADRVIKTAGNKTIYPGWKTVENFFSFSNHIVRLGFHAGRTNAGFDLGLQAYSIRYRLDQEDFVLERKRTQFESWTEWTFTGGITVNVAGFDLRYSGSVTTGTGQPGIQNPVFTGSRMAADVAAFSSEFIIAPSGSLTLREAMVWSHRLSVVVDLDW